MLKKLLFILISVSLTSLSAFSIFPFLNVPNNAENIGYVAYNSSLNSFVYNPSYDLKKNWGTSFSYNMLPFNFYHFSANFQIKLKSRANIGVSLTSLFSDKIPIYDVSSYYDPVLNGWMSPNFSTFTFNYIPAKNSFFSSHWKYGISVKLMREYLGDETLWGVGSDFGVHTSYLPYWKFGFALKNILLPFIKNIPLPPLQLDAGMNFKFPISKFYLLEICLNNSYILMDNDVVMAGLRHNFYTTAAQFSILMNYQFSVLSTYLDGWNIGLNLLFEQISFLHFTYLIDYKNGEWLHNINVVVRFL